MADESPFEAFDHGLGAPAAAAPADPDDPFAAHESHDAAPAAAASHHEAQSEEEEPEEDDVGQSSAPMASSTAHASGGGVEGLHTPSGTATHDDPFANVDSSSSSSTTLPALGGEEKLVVEEDDSAYTAWEKDRAKVLAERQTKADEKKRELLEQAKEDLAKFYSDLEQRIDKTKKQNRVDEKSYKTELGALMAHGTRWEKVAKFSNLTARPNDAKSGVSRVDRLRKLLIGLKAQRDPLEQKS
jgi:hypothetical protein